MGWDGTGYQYFGYHLSLDGKGYGKGPLDMFSDRRNCGCTARQLRFLDLLPEWDSTIRHELFRPSDRSSTDHPQIIHFHLRI